MQILFHWTLDRKISDSMFSLGLSRVTLVDWHNFAREICQNLFSRREKFGGDGYIIQIDESLMRGKRKANRGRLLLGDGIPNENPVAEDSDSDSSDNEDENANNRRRIAGPWVFGLALCKVENDGTQTTKEVRCFVVERRDRVTLEAIISRECIPGSTIHSDEWPAYNHLSELGFIHNTVNHSENFVDPETRTHTQNIENNWGVMKLKILKSMKGTQEPLLESHLSQFWFKSLHKNPFEAFTALLLEIAHQHPV